MSAPADLWPFLLAGIVPVIQAAAAVHVLLHKRDTRAAVGWMGLIWLVPLIGAILYAFLGINRIQRKARTLRPEPAGYEDAIAGGPIAPRDVVAHLGPEARQFAGLARLGDAVTGRPLLGGNAVSCLVDGDEAYPAMLDAIRGARRSVALLTYIFDNDRVGTRFRDALREARARGVEVRVLIDDVGARYSRPSMVRALRRARVPVARFMPSAVPWRMPYFNLRNHRKIMVVDGHTAFTGGMNIRDEFWRAEAAGHDARDLHFRIQGPVVCEIQEVFAEDWTFTTGERLEGPAWFPDLARTGPVIARGISDGPDIDYEKLETVLLGALSRARSSVRILTPYFLTDQFLIRALAVADLRGVDVEVVLPEEGNLAMVQWASTAQLDLLVEKGVRVFASPPPFDHSKLMVVDGCWTLLGSANWDPRSLQLNFEFNVECYDRELGSRMEALFAERRDRSDEITLDELRDRSLPVRLRDSVA
ncbi:MAG TPA: cardiolipin synthase, partial [Longimicrobiales bacterium]|nr:cardiolipin synthase [Longimicrobiales bacterium]